MAAPRRYDDTVNAAKRRVARQGPGRAHRHRLARARRAGLHLRRARASTSTRPSGTVERQRPSSASRATAGRGSLFAAAGLLLLLGSPIHWGAKSMAFIVGVAFVVGALISLSDGDDILGIVATNNWTTLVMGAGGAGADRALDDAARRPPPRRRADGHPHRTRSSTLETPSGRRFGRDRDGREPMENGAGDRPLRGTLEDRR